MKKIIIAMLMAIISIGMGQAQLTSSFPPKSYPASILVVTDPGVAQYWDVKRIMYLGPGNGGHKFRVYGSAKADHRAASVDIHYIRLDDKLQSAGAYFFPEVKAGESFNFDIVSAYPSYSPTSFLGFMIKDDLFPAQQDEPTAQKQNHNSSKENVISPLLLQSKVRIGTTEEYPKNPYNGDWIAFSGGVPYYVLSFNPNENSDLFGTYYKDKNDKDGFSLLKSKIASRGTNSITFKDKHDDANRLTLTYNPSQKSISVSLGNRLMGTYYEPTSKLTYFYIAYDDDFMNDSNGSRTIGQVKAGRRYKYSDVLKMENDYVYIRRPVDTNGWANFYNLIPGVSDPIKAKEFPLAWKYEDEESTQTIIFKKQDQPDKIISIWESKAKGNSSENCNQKIGYIGTIDGYFIGYRQQMDFYGEKKLNIINGSKEMKFIPGPNIYGDGCKLVFEDKEFIPMK